MRRQYTLWEKLKRRGRHHLTPEETLDAKDRQVILQTSLIAAIILLNFAIILGLTSLR